MDATCLTFALEGRIDANNASNIEAKLNQALDGTTATNVELDARALTYISSAGLRVILRALKRMDGKVSLVEVAPDVYDVFSMTGLTEIMDVTRALRRLSLDGAELMGRGANGEVWRLDPETVAKVYNPGTELEKVRRENEVARAAFTSGLPCAIAFDTVRVDERYGIVFELLDAQTVGHLVAQDPTRIPELGHAMGTLMRKMHATHPSSTDLPRAADKAEAWISYLEQEYLSPEDAQLMRDVANAIPATDTLIHMDFHEGNVMIQNDELALIDLDDMCLGSPLYDLVSHWIGHVMAPQTTPDAVKGSYGMSAELTQQMYGHTMRAYFGTDDPQVLERHNQAMQLFSLYFVVLFLAKGRDSNNLTPERVQGVLSQILPQFRQLAPQIIRVASSYHVA